MSACGNCGAAFEADESRCQTCGAERRLDVSLEFSLTSLQPEAEPPLPAAHDELRGGTPLTGNAPVAVQTRIEKHVPGRSLAALAPLSTPLPMTVPPPRNIDVDVGMDQPSWALPATWVFAWLRTHANANTASAPPSAAATRVRPATGARRNGSSTKR